MLRRGKVVRLPKPRPEDVAVDLADPDAAPEPVPMPMPIYPPIAPPGLGATYVAREYADQTVEMLAKFGIISEVIEAGRYFRVKVYPLPPKGTH